METRKPDLMLRTYESPRVCNFNPLDFDSDEVNMPNDENERFRFWKPSGQLYSVIFEQFDSMEAAKKAFHAINVKVDRWCKTKYPTVSCMTGLSQTVGKGAKRITVSGKRGRPEIVVTGTADKPHIHSIVFGRKAATFCNELTSDYNKKKQKSVARHIAIDSYVFISYLYNQSQCIRICGDFDFKPYTKNDVPDRYEYLRWLDLQDGGGRAEKHSKNKKKRQRKYWKKSKNMELKNAVSSGKEADCEHIVGDDGCKNGPKSEISDLKAQISEEKRAEKPWLF